MSMPTFPENGIDLSREQALNMLLGSIAMEELALSHIMNAEGEKLQYLLGTLPGTTGCCASVKELLEVNRSITLLLEQASQNQMLLKNKLAQVVEVLQCTVPCPPPTPCKPSTPCVLTACKGFCWKNGRRLLWQQPAGSGGRCWCGESPAVVTPPHGCATLLSWSMQLLPARPGVVSVALVRIQGSMREELLCCDACACAQEMPVTLTGCTLLQPTATPAPCYWVLKKPCSAVVYQATLCLTLL